MLQTQAAEVQKQLQEVTKLAPHAHGTAAQQADTEPAASPYSAY